MRQLMMRLLSGVTRFFQRLGVARPTLASHRFAAPPPPTIQHCTPVDADAASDAKDGGRFYYLGDLLDQLDDAFKYLKMLKHDDPDAYDLYKSVGGSILPQPTFGFCKLDSAVVGHLPAFFLTNFLIEDGKKKTGDEGWIGLKLAYFQKLKRFAPIQRTNHTVYKGGVYYVGDDQPDKKRIGFNFFVAVSDEGVITPLKIDSTWSQYLKPKHGRGQIIHHRKFTHPEALVCVAREHKMTVEDAAAMMFAGTANNAIQAESGFTVRVEKGGVTARFAIDMLRTPYFFKDRDNKSNGKKIFHIVRTHERQKADGGSTSVRSHFRGLRQFDWKGYAVSITVPGLHYMPLHETDITALDADDPDAKLRKMFTQAEAGKHIAQHMNRPLPNKMSDLLRGKPQ